MTGSDFDFENMKRKQNDVFGEDEQWGVEKWQRSGEAMFRWRAEMGRAERDLLGWVQRSRRTESTMQRRCKSLSTSLIFPRVLFALCSLSPHPFGVSVQILLQHTDTQTLYRSHSTTLHYKVGSHQHATLDYYISGMHRLRKISCWSETRVFLFSEYRLWLKPIHVNDSSNIEGDLKPFLIHFRDVSPTVLRLLDSILSSLWHLTASCEQQPSCSLGKCHWQKYSKIIKRSPLNTTFWHLDKGCNVILIACKNA